MCTTSSAATTEAHALMTWKESLSSPPPSLNSWSLKNTTNLCTWTGIRCNNGGFVSKIHLSDQNLNGTLDKLLFNSFSNLTSFNLSSTGLRGSILHGIGDLTELMSLDLSHNLLDKAIPPQIVPYQICKLQKVQHLDVGSNHLETPNWSKFSSFPLLQHLNFHYNKLTLDFPGFIPTCLNLTHLDLSYNKITGQIPPSLGLLTNLETLDLGINAFTGKLPSSIFMNLTKLYISGEIPLIINGITKLQTLHLFSNNLTGAIPPAVGDLAFLDILILSPRLANISFSYNSFYGELPPGLCDGFALEYFTTVKKTFSGPLSECLKKCSRLRRVRLEDNYFSGNISEAFGVHEKLVNLSLNNNKFSGLTPKWGKFEQLTSVQMGHNRITGVLPTELGDLAELCILALDSNELIGGVPDNLGKLLRLNLSNNQLGMGNIPFELGELTRLQYLLDLINNSLSGIIPSSLGKLVQLEILNLSHTSFSGKIPLQLSGMISLKSVDFSYNNMSAPVPSYNIFRIAHREAFAENAGLLIL
ncbi:hypothetical protein ACS0TY_012965 [Phlomoides rotata]